MFKHFLKTLLLLVSLWGAMVPLSHSLERRVALVIGNANYPTAPLTNPVNDARDMATTLRNNGFEVIELIDGNQKDMNRAISRFGQKLTPDTVALFYYAGHGLQVKGKNYLVPIDAQISNERSISVESVDVDGLLDQLGSSDVNVVILDACRNNPFERRFRSIGGGLAQMDAPKGSLIAYATSPGKTAADGDGRNGLFTQELLKQMQIPGLTIEQVFKYVRREVMRATQSTQVPWESSSMTGDFYFIPGNRIPASAAVRPTSRPVSFSRTVDEESKPAIQPAKPQAASIQPENSPQADTLAAVSTQPATLSDLKEKLVKTDSFTISSQGKIDASGATTGMSKIEWQNGDRYDGGLVAGKKHGQGTFVWGDGKRYEGEWSNDAINGRGKLVYTNGDKYEGEFLNGEPHGHGVYTLSNGDVYTGAWAQGNKHGKGRLTWVGGDYWDGEFRDDQQTTNGKLVYGTAPEPPVENVGEKPAAEKSASKPAPLKKAK